MSHSPHGDIDFVGDGVDVRGQGPQLLVHVLLHHPCAIHTIDHLVRVDGRQNRTNECLQKENTSLSSSSPT